MLFSPTLRRPPGVGAAVGDPAWRNQAYVGSDARAPAVVAAEQARRQPVITYRRTVTKHQPSGIELIIESPSQTRAASSGVRAEFSEGNKELKLTRNGVSIVKKLSLNRTRMSLSSRVHVVAWDAFQFPYIVCFTNTPANERRVLTTCMDFCPDVTRNDALVHGEYGEASYHVNNLWILANKVAQAVRSKSVHRPSVESSWMHLSNVLSRLAVKFNVFSNMDAVFEVPPFLRDIEHVMASAIQMLDAPEFVGDAAAQACGRILRFLYVMYPVLTAWYDCCYTEDNKIGAGLLDRNLVDSNDGDNNVKDWELSDITNILYRIARYGTTSARGLSMYEEPFQLSSHSTKHDVTDVVRAFIGLDRSSYTALNKTHAELLMQWSRPTLYGKLNPKHFELVGNGSGGVVFKFQQDRTRSMYVLKVSSVCNDVIKCAKELLSMNASARRTPAGQMRMATVSDAVRRFEVPCEYRVTEHLRNLGVVDWRDEEEHWFATVHDGHTGNESLLYLSVSVYNTRSVGQLFRDFTVSSVEAHKLHAMFKYVVGYCYSQLRRLHLAGVCHGDPHVYNFMVTNLGTLQIIDWDASMLLAERPHHTPGSGWSMFVPLVRDEDGKRDFSVFSVTKIVPAMEALFFFTHTFVHAGKPLSEVHRSEADLLPFAKAISAWLDRDGPLRDSVLVTFSRLRKLLGAGNWLLSAPRRTHFHPNQYAVLPSYTQQLHELGHTAPLMSGGELTDGTSDEVAWDLHQTTALEHFSQLLRVQDRVLAILDEFFTSTALSDYESMVAGRAELMSTIPISVYPTHKEVWQRSNLDTRYPTIMLEPGAVLQNEQFVAGRCTVLDLNTQLVYTRLPQKLERFIDLLKAACGEYNLRDAADQPEFVVDEYKIMPGRWVCSTHSMTSTMPAGFRFNQTNRKLYIWNSAQIDQLSPLWKYMRHEGLLSAQIQHPHTRPDEPEDEPEFRQPRKSMRLAARVA